MTFVSVDKWCKITQSFKRVSRTNRIIKSIHIVSWTVVYFNTCNWIRLLKRRVSNAYWQGILCRKLPEVIYLKNALEDTNLDRSIWIRDAVSNICRLRLWIGKSSSSLWRRGQELFGDNYTTDISLNILSHLCERSRAWSRAKSRRQIPKLGHNSSIIRNVEHKDKNKKKDGKTNVSAAEIEN